MSLDPAPAPAAPRQVTHRPPDSGPLGLLVYALGSVLLVALATRLVLLGMHLRTAGDPWRDVVLALFQGFRQDLLVAGWLCLPLVLLLAVLSPRHAAGRAVRRFLALGGIVAAFALLLVAVAEVLFFAEFDGRFNFVAVDYLIYPTEVTGNLRESYPIPAILLAIAIGTAATWPLLRRRLDGLAIPLAPRARLCLAAGYVLALALLLGSRPAVRVSDDRTLNEVAANGIASFWDALRGVDAPYRGLYATSPDSLAVGRVRTLLAQGAGDDTVFRRGTTRLIDDNGPARPLNVVIVLEESFGADFVGALHGGRGITPGFDSLVPQGTLLTHAYSTGNRTIRALEAITASIPPLPGISIVRRPASHGLRTLPEVLRERGYTTGFIYGGRALFDGMGGYLRANGIDRVIQQGDFPDSVYRTAWGVADEYIFDRTLAELDSLDATGRPSFTLVLTVSNHRPYTYPAGRIAQDPGRKRRSHAVRYADWALARFMREARGHRFYEHTLFVLMGDHGARVYGAAEIPLHSYEVPVLFVAPKVVPAGRRLGTIASSLDVPPTVLGLLGGEYWSTFFGRDLFRLPEADGGAPLTHNNDLALLEGDQLAVLGLHGSTRLFRRAGKAWRPAKASRPGTDPVGDAIAYFQTADRLYRSGELRVADRR